MAIRFRNPKLERMHNGNLCVELTEAGTWESFEGFAEKWAAQIGAKIQERIDGPDVRLWHILYERHQLLLVYNDYPNAVSVEATEAEANVAIEKLFSIVMSESVPNGV
jgi:hypothetical protein